MFYKYKLFLKFFLTTSNGKIRNSILFQIISIYMGGLIIFLTFSIMDGMHKEIFDKIKSFNYKHIIYHNPNEYIQNYNYDNYGTESIVKIEGEFFSTFINAYAFNDLEIFTKNKISKHLIEQKNDYQENSIIIGESFASQYNISIGDTLKIGDITQINPISGSFSEKEYIVGNIFSFPFLSYDFNNCYLQYNEKFLNRQNKSIFTDSSNDNKILMKNNLNTYNSLISAIILEKYIYTGLGFIVIFISCIMIFNNTIMLILEKNKQKIILKSLGINNTNFLIILFNVLIGFTMLILSLGTTLFIMFLNYNYLILNNIFLNSPFKIIPMILSVEKVIFSFLLIMFMIIISSNLSFKIIYNTKNRTIV